MATLQDTPATEPLIIPEEKPKDSEPKQVSFFKGQIILNPTISKLNFFTFVFQSMFMGIIFVPIGLLQTPLLTNIYHLTTAEVLNLSSLSQAVMLTTKLLLAPLLGYLCDMYGRKFLIVSGLVIQSASIFITPDLPGVYPWYIIQHIVLELGMMLTMAAPLLADYVDYETKGRVAGMLAVLSYTTSFVTSYINESIDTKHNIAQKYHQVGVIGLVLGLIISLGLKGGSYHKKLYYDKKAVEAKKSLAKDCPEAYSELMSENYLENPEPEGQTPDEESGVHKRITAESSSVPRDIDRNQLNINPSIFSQEGENTEQRLIDQQKNAQTRSSAAPKKKDADFKPGLMAGVREAQKNPWILCSYVCGFLMISNVSLLNLILVNYIKYLTGNADWATNQAYVLTNKHFLVGAFSAIFFGFYADKYNKFKLIVFVILTSFLAVLLLTLTPTATHFMAYASMFLFGVACAGFMTFVVQLQSKYANPKYRASVAAVGGMCSVIGTATINILGVYLMQYNVRIPFYFYMFFSLIALAILGLIYNAKKEILNRL